MNRKITDFALTGKCDGLGASGLTRGVPAAPKPSRTSRLWSAIAPNPWATSRSTFRRVRFTSWDIKKLTSVQQRKAELWEIAALSEESMCKRQLGLIRFPRERQLISSRDLRRLRFACLCFHPACNRGRLLGHKLAVHQRERLKGVCRHRSDSAGTHGVGLIEVRH